MEHVLDNPVWNALISGNLSLADGNGEIRFFTKDVSPFVGLKSNSSLNFRHLHDSVTHQDPVILISNQKINIPDVWNVLYCIEGFQMVYEQLELSNKATIAIIPLQKKHVPQMLALTKLTNPGPFAERTIDFGHYYGVFEEKELVAMAGQRLHVFGYAEISAVCTHPDHLGKGYARQLLKYQIQRIQATSGIPFLHVRSDNERAIKVYESLGFSTRTNVYFYVLKKA